MDYSLRELECFTAVAEELSFTRAARRLHLAQPPLSRHVRTLEDKLGAALFTREARRVALTPAGRRFFEETRGVLQQLTRAADMVRRAAQGEVTRLRLGFVSAVVTTELVGTFRAFRKQHPAVQIVLHDLPPAEQLGQIAAGLLDGGFVGLTPQERATGIQFTPWRQEQLAAYLPPGHRLLEKERIALKELAGERFVAVSHEAAPAFAAFIHEACRKAGFRPRIVLESPRAQAVAVMAAAGSGVALLPETLAQTLGMSGNCVRLSKAPVIRHVFAHRAGKPEPALQDFLTQMQKSA